MPSSPVPSPHRTRIDNYLEVFHVQEVHSTEVAASPELTYRTMRGLDLWNVGAMRFLFGLRELPARLMGRWAPRKKMDFEAMCEMGFVFLEERPYDEFVLGIVAKFWSLSPAPIKVEPADFRGLRMPGHCKAVWNFHFEPLASGTRVTTRTRVEMGSRLAGVLFRIYWLFVAPFSGLIRVAILRHLRATVEAIEAPADEELQGP